MANAPTTFLNDYSPVGIVIDKPDATSYSQTGLQIQPSGETGGADAGNNPISLSQLQGGVYNGIFIVGGGQLQSPNFVTGVSGWQILSDGNVEFGSGKFRGDITGATGTFSGTVSVGSLNIPDQVTANSFHVDTSGNAWWGSTTLGTAKASVLNTGVANFTSTTTIGSSVFIGLNLTGGMLSVFGDVNLPLINGPQGTEPTGYQNNTGAQGTFTSVVGQMKLQLTGTAAAGEVGITTPSGLIDLSANIIFAIDFKFNQFTFTGSASDSTMQYIFMVGVQATTSKQNCFGLLATKTGTGAQTLVFSAANYSSAGTPTLTTITPTVNVTNKLVCVYQPNIQIQFFLNGTLVATNTTNLPTITGNNSQLLCIDGQVQNSNVSSPPTATISRFHVVGKGLS